MLDVLKPVEDPVADGNIIASGVVRALNVEVDGAVRFVMEIAPDTAQA